MFNTSHTVITHSHPITILTTTKKHSHAHRYIKLGTIFTRKTQYHHHAK